MPKISSKSHYRFLNRLPLSLALALTMAVLAGGCTRGYWQARKLDALDTFYVSGGLARGVAVTAFVSPCDFTLGYYRSIVSGWDGRQLFRRYETGAGLPIIGSGTEQYEILEPRQFTIDHPPSKKEDYLKRIDINNPEPYSFDAYSSFFSILPFDSAANIVGNHVFFQEYLASLSSPDFGRPETTPSWGWGIGLTPGLVSLRLGIRPNGVPNFITGWLGFHLFPPYQAGSNKLDFDMMRHRGILIDDARSDPLRYILADLGTTADGYGYERNMIRQYSFKLLGLMGEKARPAIPRLMSIKSNGTFDNKILAVLALSRIEPGKYPAKPALRELAAKASEQEKSQLNKIMGWLQ